jgi:hypothetical protein
MNGIPEKPRAGRAAARFQKGWLSLAALIPALWRRCFIA